ncbi:MAG TPA: FAD-binding oxidoreductase [Gaiellaceae bacterium]
MDSLLTKAATSIFERLSTSLDGELVLPSSPGWDEARTAWNLAVDQRPAAVVLAESASDVAKTVQIARSAGLRVAPQGTGHGATPLGDLSDTILLRTSRMRGVSVDARRHTARVEAGVLWQELTDAAAEHGLAGLAGSSHDVGVVGYTLGGGISWLARKYGLSSNSVLAAEIVDAEGNERRVDYDNDPDLFWAIRGGGAFAVVTAVEMRLYPIEEIYAGTLFFPIDGAREVLSAWLELTDRAPDELMSVGRLMRFPDLPMVPEPVRGKEFALVEVAYLGSEADGIELTRPLRELGPVLDTTAMIPARRLSELHMDPPAPVPGIGDGRLLDALSIETVDAIVEAAGAESGSTLLSVEVRQLGGALGRRAEGDGAAFLDSEFALFAVGIAPPVPEIVAKTRGDVARVLAAVDPWESGRDYLNFREDRTTGERLFSGETHARLRAIKEAVDPANVIRSNHEV